MYHVLSEETQNKHRQVVSYIRRKAKKPLTNVNLVKVKSRKTHTHSNEKTKTQVVRTQLRGAELLLLVSHLHSHRGKLRIRPVRVVENHVHARAVADGVDAVSYTHLTLPTIYSV